MAKPKTMTRWIFNAPPALFARIDVWAAANGITHRAEAVRQLLRAALDAADNRLTPEDLAELEALRRDFDANSIREAIAAARRTARTLEAEAAADIIPPLRLVPPAPPAPAPEPAPPPGWWSQAKRTLSSLVM